MSDPESQPEPQVLGGNQDSASNTEKEFTALNSKPANVEVKRVAFERPESSTLKPLIMGLIDGDGCIFTKKLIAGGHEGGRSAALQLKNLIRNDYKKVYEEDCMLLVDIFIKGGGLKSTILDNFSIDDKTFNNFMNGFNTSSDMSMLDVGDGTEAVDNKICERLKIFASDPRVKKIYFGGGHDGGYAKALTKIQEDGNLSKITLLQGYTRPTYAIGTYKLTFLMNDGLFIPGKLDTPKKSNTPKSSPQLKARSSRDSLNNPEGRQNSTKLKQTNSLFDRVCRDYHLKTAGCPVEDCPYDHVISFTSEQLEEFRKFVQSFPCNAAKKGQKCADDECLYGHHCPSGPECKNKQGNCRFSGPGMHDPPELSLE